MNKLIQGHDGGHLFAQASILEAQETVNLWYSDKIEVLEWQNALINETHINGLLGRACKFPSFLSITRPQRNRTKRAAISAPVQVLSFYP